MPTEQSAKTNVLFSIYLETLNGKRKQVLYVSDRVTSKILEKYDMDEVYSILKATKCAHLLELQN